MSDRRIILPTFHADQLKAYRYLFLHRFQILRCGRRYGKTDYGKIVAGDDMTKRRSVGWFAPDHKTSSAAFDELVDMLNPIVTAAAKQHGYIKVVGGGIIEFWTLENDRAGRSRKYHRVIFDEAAFSKKNAIDIWNRSIKPTLLDYGGRALIMSNANGIDPENFLYMISPAGADKRIDPNKPNGEHGFAEYHAPTRMNPYLPPEEIAKLKAENAPLVYQQEYEAEFVDWSGVAFFAREKLLVNNEPVPYPVKCDAILCIVDTATKTGQEHDGTAVTFFAVTIGVPSRIPLVILDWDVVQVEGSLLGNWLPELYRRGEELAQACGARGGFLGAWIEDKSSGMVLLQQSMRAGEKVRPIDSKLTSVGKVERAINASPYVHQDKVKFSQYAYNKVTKYKNVTRNHLWGQVTGFRVGVKETDPHDDLLDTFTYGIMIALGNLDGF